LVAADTSTLITLDAKTASMNCGTDLKDEANALICNEKSKLFCLGYASGEVILYSNEMLENPNPLTRFKMPIRNLSISEDGKFLISCSEDPIANFANLNENPIKLADCLPGHDGSIKSCAMHPKGLYCATTGCDGYINIYQIKENSLVNLVRRQKITEDKNAMILSSPQKLHIKWSLDGKYLYIAGDYMLRIIETEKWEIKNIPEIITKPEISLIEPLNENIIVIGTLANSISIWNLLTKTCIANFDVEGTKINEIKYSIDMHLLGILTNSNIGILEITDEILKPAAPALPVQQDTEMKNADTIQEDVKNQENIEQENIVKPEIKKKPMQSKLAAIIDAEPQEAFQVNATEYDDNWRFLCWNSVGSITLLSRPTSVSISIDFANKSSQRSFTMPDQYGISLAAICPSGAIMASPYEPEKIPDPLNAENPLPAQPAKNSVIQFVPFHEWRGIKGWTYELEKGESAQIVALGTRWAAVYTSDYVIRVFSHEGIQKHIFCMESPVVTMCGYENLLAIIYHNSVPILGNQRMNIRLLDMKNNYECLLDTPLALSTSCLLKWIGFSEEGQIFSYDTNGILRSLLQFNGNSWIPVLDVKSEDTNRDIWIVSISKNSVTGLESKESYFQPKLIDKPKIKEFPFKIPLIKLENSQKNEENSNFEESYLMSTLQMNQAEYRKKQWGKLKMTRKPQDPEYGQTASISNDEDLLKMQKDLDKMLIDKVRQSCVDNEVEKAVSYAEMMNLSLSLNLAVKLAQKLNKNEIADKISILLDVFFSNFPNKIKERIIKEQTKKTKGIGGKIMVTTQNVEKHEQTSLSKNTVPQAKPEPMQISEKKSAIGTGFTHEEKKQSIKKQDAKPVEMPKKDEEKHVEKQAEKIVKNPFAKADFSEKKPVASVFGAFSSDSAKKKKS